MDRAYPNHPEGKGESLHTSHVNSHIRNAVNSNPHDLSHPCSWSQFGGSKYEKFVSVRCFIEPSQKKSSVESSGDSMTFHTATLFPHRRNKDGSFNSICLQCFATIASHMTEEELQELDKHHVCEKSILSERGNHVSLSHNENKVHEPQ